MTQKHHTEAATEIIFTGLWCSVVCYLITHRNCFLLRLSRWNRRWEMKVCIWSLPPVWESYLKKPEETANPANLSFVLVWSPPCKWSAPIKKIWFPVPVSVFISVWCFQGKKKHSLTHIFLNKQFVLGYVWCKAFLLWDIHFYTPEGKQQTRKKQTR